MSLENKKKLTFLQQLLRAIGVVIVIFSLLALGLFALLWAICGNTHF
jgi:hypothetical protein